MATYTPEFTLKFAYIPFSFGVVTLPVLVINVPGLAADDNLNFGTQLYDYFVTRLPNPGPVTFFKNGEPINPWGFASNSVTSTDGQFTFATVWTASTQYHYSYNTTQLNYNGQLIGCTLNPSGSAGSEEVRCSPICLIYDENSEKWVCVFSSTRWPSYAVTASQITNNGDIPYGLIGGYPPIQPLATTVRINTLIDITGINFVSEDPYAPGGHSGGGGGPGTGTFDLGSDAIGLPPLPTLSFASTGFTRIYNPSLYELNALANYLWTDQTFLNTVINHLKQLLENPMDAVISLSLLPCQIPNGTPEAVKVMYINTGVNMAPATTQFVDVDCGTYTLQEFYGSALDYNPYTKVHCYLPYIGQVTLDPDEVMGRTLQVVYRIDIVTGMCSAMILVNQNVIYQFSGHCSINMPINSADFSGYIGAAMTAGKMVAGVVAGATGNMALAAELTGAPAPHSSTTETTEKKTERNPKTGRQVTSGTSTKTSTHTTPGASFGEMSRKAVANTVGSVMGGKLVVEHAGGFTGNSGYLAVRRPYLIIERPRMCNPEEYSKYNGRPSMIYMLLADCSGYTEVQGIHFEGISASNPELSELSELLKSGVIF